MKNKIQEQILELLAGEALHSLSDEERAELLRLKQDNPDLLADDSFEVAASAFHLASSELKEEMPAHLANRVSEQADDYWRATFGQKEDARQSGSIQSERPKIGFVQWLGWALAGAASIALVVNIWYTGFGARQLAGGERPTPTIQEKTPTIAEKRSQLLASTSTVRTNWTSPQKDLNVAGEVVWSDEEQEGYMTFRGLPVNDRSKETYQLWIFDETQDEATPIDGGIFDVSETGEAIIPIDANLRVSGPKAFAVTVEKPGGVVVSKRERIVALAEV